MCLVFFACIIKKKCLSALFARFEYADHTCSGMAMTLPLQGAWTSMWIDGLHDRTTQARHIFCKGYMQMEH